MPIYSPAPAHISYTFLTKWWDILKLICYYIYHDIFVTLPWLMPIHSPVTSPLLNNLHRSVHLTRLALNWVRNCIHIILQKLECDFWNLGYQTIFLHILQDHIFFRGPTVLSPQIWFGRLWLIFKILINYTFLTHSSEKLPIQGPYKSWDAGWYFLMLLVIMAHTRTVGDNRFYLYLMYFLHFFVFECMLVYFRRCGAHWDSWR